MNFWKSLRGIILHHAFDKMECNEHRDSLCAFRSAWRRQRCALPLFLVSTVDCRRRARVPKPKRQGRAESFLSYRWTLGPPTVLLPCKYTLSSVNEECYLLVHPSQWLIFQRNFQIGQLFKEGQQKVPKRLFRTWWPGVVFRALALGC